MEPIREEVKTVLDVIREVDRIKEFNIYDHYIAKRLRHTLYFEVLKQISRLATDEYSRDMAIEALNAEDDQ